VQHKAAEAAALNLEPAMKALIERQLYQPGLVLPLLALTRLMVTLDFSISQVLFVIFMRGAQYTAARVAAASRRSIGLSLQRRRVASAQAPRGVGAAAKADAARVRGERNCGACPCT
jgi:hypothetical protein